MVGPGDAIEKCPFCRYALTGLPTRHRCPECGFEYDETTQVWWPPGGRLWIVLCIVGLWTFGLINPIRQLLSPGAGGWSAILAILHILAVIAGSAVLILALRARPFVAADARAMHFRMPLRQPRSIPWSDLTFAAPGAEPHRSRSGRNERVRLPIAFMGREERIELLDALHGYWERAKR